jgi:hypothetical protein
MAHSIQHYGARMAFFVDLDLLVIICFMGRIVRQRPGRFASLADSVAEWQKYEYAPGTINLDLDRIAASETSVVEFNDLLTEVEGEFRAAGKFLEKQTLNSSCRVPGVVFNDFPVSSLLECVEELKKLMGPLRG